MRKRAPRFGFAISALSMLLLATTPAAADDYDSENSAHPLRIAGYALHPVGVILETILVKPAHWLVSFRPMRKLFGHKEPFADDNGDDLMVDSGDSDDG